MSNPTTKKLDIRLPADIRARIDEAAKERSTEDVKVKAADIVREALAAYFDESAEVNRGGVRPNAGRPFGSTDRIPRIRRRAS